MRILIAALIIIFASLPVRAETLKQQNIRLKKERDQAQKIVDTFSITLDSGNFESVEAVKSLWAKLLEENKYIITGKFCDKDSSGACIE